MRLNKKLNIVIPIDTEQHGQIFVHSAPIGREVFEMFYSELGQVFTQCFDSISKSHMALSAPQLAYPALKKIAMNAGNWEGQSGVRLALINEIVRLTNVSICGEKGWDMLPLDTVIKRAMLEEDEESEVISSLVFFTSISLVAPKPLRVSFLEMAGSIRNWELTSLDCTAYMNGLRTSIKEETTDLKAKA